jgi:predicted nucleic acid-binding protein
MITAILDTNVILRYILKDNAELFERAKPFMDSLRSGQNQALILEGVLVECVYVLSKVYKVPRDEIADTLSGILRYPGIVDAGKERYARALTLFCRHNVDIVDALLYATAIERGFEIFSFDKDLERLKQVCGP